MSTPIFMEFASEGKHVLVNLSHVQLVTPLTTGGVAIRINGRSKALESPEDYTSICQRIQLEDYTLD